MRKLYLMMDNWNENKPFVQSEIGEIRKQFDVSIICNDTPELRSEDFPEGLKYYKYAKKSGIRTLLHALKFITDKAAWDEIRTISKSETTNKKSQVLEVLKFYINAELYFDFIKKNNLIDKELDAIYYSYWYFWKCFAITKHRKEYPNIKVITRTHEYDLFDTGTVSGYQPFKMFMDARLDRVIFIAEHGRQFYFDKYDVNKSEKYPLCHLGTRDYGVLNPYEKGDVFNVVSCSSLIPRKRVNLIIEALSTIRDEKINWVHFGGGPLEKELKQGADELLANHDNITYEFKGFTRHDVVMKYYCENSVDAFLMVSSSEGNPVSVMEAMSFGIPIISTSINNMPNVINGNGYLLGVNPRGEEIADTISRMANCERDVILDMRYKSRDIWVEKYRSSANDKSFVDDILRKL